MARLEGAYEKVSQRLMNIDPRFDGVDRKIDLLREALDKKLDMIDAKNDRRFNALEQHIDAKIDQRFMWTVGIIVTTWLTTMGTTIGSIYFHH
jgi:hypothetical protein